MSRTAMRMKPCVGPTYYIHLVCSNPGRWYHGLSNRQLISSYSRNDVRQFLFVYCYISWYRISKTHCTHLNLSRSQWVKYGHNRQLCDNLPPSVHVCEQVQLPRKLCQDAGAFIKVFFTSQTTAVSSHVDRYLQCRGLYYSWSPLSKYFRTNGYSSYSLL